MIISSKDNDIVRLARRLLADAKTRRAENLFVIEGARLCEDAARSGVSVQTALFTARAKERYPAQTALIEQVSAHVFDITEPVAASLSETDSAQGVFCVCKALDNRQMLDTIEEEAFFTFNKEKKWLALEDVRDPANIGTVIRTAEALGIGGLILSAGCCDVYNPKVLRGSMGGVFRLPLFETADMARAIARLQQKGFCGYACVPVADEKTLSVLDAPLTAGCICVVGNEANGLTAETIAACHHSLTIPMAGRAESLNAAVASSLVLWEMARRDC